MTKTLLGPLTPTPKRSVARAILLAGSLMLITLLAACGSTTGSGPLDSELDPERDPELDPAAITVFLGEAEAHLAGRSFVTGSDARASSGAYVAIDGRVADSGEGVASANVSFTVAEAGEHSLWVRAFAPSTAGDAVYLGLGDQLDRTFAPETGRYVWFEVARQYLAVGPQSIQVAPGESGLRLDLIAVVRDPAVGHSELDELVRPGPQAPTPEPSVPPEAGAFSLRGDPGFDVGSLSGAQRMWYERSLSATVSSVPGTVSKARADDMYYYGRELFQFSSAALLGLRSTGDLQFLDALDPMMEALRGQLYDGWCGGVDGELYVNERYGTVEEHDGFRNFRVRVDASRDYCRDVADLDEALTHGHLAMVMYAYHLNQDLVSPAGVDYAERADFWFEYLRDDFEAKWRSRTGVASSDMDFIDLKFSHTYNVFTLYYYFMGMKLASEGSADAAAYLERASSLTDAMFDQRYEPRVRGGGFVAVSSSSGDAVVYSFGAPGRGEVSSTHLEATATTYARYVMSAVLALRLEGFERWDDEIMMQLVNGLTGFVIDDWRVSSVSDTISASVTGDSMVGGMPPTTFRSRFTVGKFGVTVMPAFAVWDGSGVLEAFSLQVYDVIEGREARPEEPSIPASMLFLEMATARALGLTASR